MAARGADCGPRAGDRRRPDHGTPGRRPEPGAAGLPHRRHRRPDARPDRGSAVHVLDPSAGPAAVPVAFGGLHGQRRSGPVRPADHCGGRDQRGGCAVGVLPLRPPGQVHAGGRGQSAADGPGRRVAGAGPPLRLGDRLHLRRGVRRPVRRDAAVGRRAPALAAGRAGLRRRGDRRVHQHPDGLRRRSRGRAGAGAGEQGGGGASVADRPGHLDAVRHPDHRPARDAEAPAAGDRAGGEGARAEGQRAGAAGPGRRGRSCPAGRDPGARSSSGRSCRCGPTRCAT